MAEDGDKKVIATDLLGTKAFGEAARTAVEAVRDGISALLSRVCLPASEEVGLLLKDKVSHWRSEQLRKFAAAAEKKLEESGAGPTAHGHPRMISSIVENASWNDDVVVNDLWAGLLASSCDETGEDDSNLIFVNLLSMLTKGQARLLNFVCETAQRYYTDDGLIVVSGPRLAAEKLKELFRTNDIHQIDRELDHLRALELIRGGFDTDGSAASADGEPTALAMHMYIRCRGSRLPPRQFFGDPEPPAEASHPSEPST